MLSALFDFQVLGKKKLLPCQVGGEFLFALVARPVHLHHARPQGPSGRSSGSAIFGFFRPGNPGSCLVSGFFRRPSGCFLFGVRVFFPGFFLGRFVFRRCFPLFPFCLLCCLAFLHLLSRARASAGTPAAMAPDPPPVVNWAVLSHPSPAGSRPRYGLVHDGWGVRAPL